MNIFTIDKKSLFLRQYIQKCTGIFGQLNTYLPTVACKYSPPLHQNIVLPIKMLAQ